MRKIAIIPLVSISLILICGSFAVGDTNPYTIPLGSATVDGNASDWASADWIEGTLVTGYWTDTLALPSDVDLANTKFAARWQTNDPDAGTPGRIYAIAVVDDSNHQLEYEFTEWCASDRLEWFVHGPNAANTRYYSNFYSAQQYVMSSMPDGFSDCWVECGYKKGDPESNGLDVDAAVSISGDLITYEISFPVYDSWEGFSHDGTTVNADMVPGAVIGFDLLVGSRQSPYPGTYNTDTYHLMDETGILCTTNTPLTHKADGNSSVMLEYTLEATAGDANLDGKVDSADLAIILAAFGTMDGMSWRDGDFDLDGDVDGNNFLGWQQGFTGVGGAVQAIPEPAGAALVLGGLIACWTLCRRRVRCVLTDR